MKRLMAAFLVMAVMALPISAQDINKLLQRVPASANLLTIIDSSALMKTPKAQAEGWSQKRNLDYLSGKTPFPPAITFAVIAAEVDTVERRNNWQISLLQFPDKVYEDKLAQREGSNVELIENLYVIPSRRNMYFVQFDRENYGIFTPANRQKMINWVKFAKNNSDSKFNPYLIDAVSRGGANGQLNIAMDLSNSLDRVEIINRLQASKLIMDSGVDRKQLTDLIAGIKGLRFSLNVTNNYIGEISIDFNDSVQPFEKVLPGFLVETLERAGYNMGDLSQWQSTTRGKTLSLKGVIDNDDVMRILHLVMPPTVDTSTNNNLSGEALVAATSQSYFKAVDSLLKDLRARSDRFDRNRDWNTNAQWYEYTIRKINSLPVVNTDDALLAYAAQVTDQLAICSENLRGVSIEGKVIDSYRRGGRVAGWGDMYGGGGAWGLAGGGFVGNTSNRLEVESAKLENAAKGTKDRNAIWTKISEQTTTIRDQMAKKYRMEF